MIIILYKFIVLIIFLSAYLQFGSSILCYDCNSLFDPRCGEEFDSFSLGVVNCSLRDPLEHMPTAEPTLCRTIKIDINGKVRVVRQCGYIKNEVADDKSCVRRAGYHELAVTYCSCTTDLCNAGHQSNIHDYLLVSPLIFCSYKLLF